MSSQNDAEHDPMEDVLMHVLCERWAEKLEVTRVEHFSPDEREAFEFHMQSCERCQDIVKQYRVVDSYFYSFMLSEHMPVAANAPSLPAGLRSRRRMHQLWERVSASLRWQGPPLRLVSAWWLQGTGLVLLVLLLLGGILFETELVDSRLVSVGIALGALAITLLVLGSRKQQEPVRNATQQCWQQTSEKQNVLAWRELSLPLPSVQIDVPEPRALRSQRRRSRATTRRNTWIWSVALCLMLAIGVIALGWLTPLFQPHTVSGGTDPTGAPVGISVDGSKVFDTSRQDGDLKREAASKMLAGDVNGAQELWRQALTLDSNDAELLIYRENLVVKDSASSYFTLVVGTIFSQQHIGGARDVLQGAYVAQQEYNARAMKSGGKLLRLMIAAADVDSLSPTTTATQIVQAAQKDPTIVGVMGWSTSRSALSALQVLSAAHIPMVSATASSDSLSGKSPYFFRVASTDTQQATLAAQYARQVLHARSVALFTDPDDTYSNSLAQAFMQHYQDSTHKLVHAPYIYTIGVPSTVESQMGDVLSHHPDLIYFAGYVNEASVVLKHLPACAADSPQCLLVLGGDALYVQGDYSLDAFKNYGRFRFTAFASPEEAKQQHPQFFADYAKDFDPLGQYRAGFYGYNATDADIILGYDATNVLIQASERLQGQDAQALNSQNLARILHTIQVNGVSGKISFDKNGNLMRKNIIILRGNENGRTTIDHSLDG
ncbi:ABC transporter substrate-binding protein [Dictyobacter arantiisoli]|uniref:Leucine-binding protein domain-containing protein n=1 Tax=Dictyobacter arantiisoli TaxID=2014874 RepID=A0A5A5TH02_9CHLR|nr:ABC transporter substrate-binding protein [Dictyobacter arantiisoli]GCF10515.1 hypothetical protein KDI_40790 [Dictyobacter arantiisoli]